MEGGPFTQIAHRAVGFLELSHRVNASQDLWDRSSECATVSDNPVSKRSVEHKGTMPSVATLCDYLQLLGHERGENQARTVAQLDGGGQIVSLEVLCVAWRA